MRTWIGLALLSVSWLFGLSYYHQTDWELWCATIIAGVAFLGRSGARMPSRGESAVALGLCLVALLLGPWPAAHGLEPSRSFGAAALEVLSVVLPYRIGLVLLVLGLALHLLDVGLRAALQSPRTPDADCSTALDRFARQLLGWLNRLPRQVCTALLAGGGVLLAQSAAILAYRAFTARSHELPWPLPRLIGAVAGLLGVDVAVYESTLATHTMRAQQMLGATWELLLDPPTLCFVVGAVVLLSWRHWTDPSPERRPWHLARSVAILLLLVAIWLPLRAGLLMAIFVHDVLRLEHEDTLTSMWIFWSPWMHLTLLAGPVLAAWRFLPGMAAEHSAASSAPQGTGPARRRQVLAASLVAGGVALLAAAVLWNPVGTRQQGRVIVEEFDPRGPDYIWERADKPFDTEWYGHLSGYNFYCIYDYCSRFYHTSRRSKGPLDADVLENCDVLVLKVPVRAYSKAEIKAVHKFVERGGGLLLIGEHTNVDPNRFELHDDAGSDPVAAATLGSSAYLNTISRKFGFIFRDDCLFGLDSVFEQHWTPPVIPHPIVQQMPPMDFATSCSIDPGNSPGRAVITDTGLKNLTADYHVSNFYPPADDRADMRYGAFVQLWATRYGKGRVLAFTDSTIFSNFSTFTPGKPELMLGMIEWLNHRDNCFDPRWPLAVPALMLLVAGLLAARGWQGAPLVLIAASLLAFSTTATGVQIVHRRAMPPPEPMSGKEMVEVVMDREVSSGKLPATGFISGKEDEFGIFERWILRLGYFTSRQQGTDVFDKDLVVFLYPNRKVPDAFRDALVQYVAAGGKVLVIDSAENEKEEKKSTANDLLEPFQLSVEYSAPRRGQLSDTDGMPAVWVEHACEVRGGRPLAKVDGKPVAATRRHGKGEVTVVGFGSRFSDANFGYTGDVIPTAEQRELFELEFSLLRKIIAGL
ncbi:MAG: hypothetical protein HQ567_03815 [Candidatus Nealsonbacteria bacterium]|nr:hypothetical protein [Candidatus Nealsonbacteria bacterium]